MKIPVFRPSIGEEEVEAVSKVLRSQWLGEGPEVIAFENEFKEYLNNKVYAAAVNSATSGLEIMVDLLTREDNRKEVITTPLTFVSTNHAIIRNGLKPVFADVEPDTLNIDPKEVHKLITKDTALIMCVHCAGHPCYMDRIRGVQMNKWIGGHYIPILQDSAHALGSQYYSEKDKDGYKIGEFGYNVFSFAAIKNITTGDGGMITVPNKELYDQIKSYRWMGIEGKYNWEYDVVEFGIKANMTDISAALGRVQLKRLEFLNGKRRLLRRMYNDEFNDIEEIETPPNKSYASRLSAHHYIIQTDKRDELINYLRNRNIATSLHHKPNHLYDIYKPYYRKLPVAERAFKRMTTLPLFPDMTELEQEYVIDKVRRFFR